jgi:trehalose 6-phosphate phosphatase
VWRDSLQDTETTIALAAFLQRIKAAPASVLLLDYDGTLAPFHVDRSLAYPYPGVVSILERIVRSGKTRVIIISGRSIVELRALLTPMNCLEMWGGHGLEHQLSDGSYSHVQVSEENAASLAEAEKWVVAAGLFSNAEIKLGGIAIHWRGMAPTEARRVQALTQRGWTALAERSGLKLLQFEAGLELRVSHPDKGDAVESILAGLDSNVPIACLGDDLTDEDAFHILSGHGLSVLVKADYRETIAGAWIRPPKELIDFLERWLSSVSG